MNIDNLNSKLEILKYQNTDNVVEDVIQQEIMRIAL